MTDSLVDGDSAILRVFCDGDALTPYPAKTVHELGLPHDAALEELMERSVVRRATGNSERLYGPMLARSFAFTPWARKASLLATFAIVVLVVVAAVLTLRR